MNVIFLLLSSLYLVSCKIYKRCELARELKTVHKAPAHQLATWVCIAEHESQYKTDAVGHMGEKGTADHGIFQINDKYWCSPPGQGRACGLTCAQLEDDDITDDFICAQKIYKEHKILSGDGFNAWVVYGIHCKGSKADKYLKECFGSSSNSNSSSKPVGIGRPTWQKPYSSENAHDKETKKTSLLPKNVLHQFSPGKIFSTSPSYQTSTTARSIELLSSTRIHSDLFFSKTIEATSAFPKTTPRRPEITVRTRLDKPNPLANSNSFRVTSSNKGIKPTTTKPVESTNFKIRNFVEPLKSPSPPPPFRGSDTIITYESPTQRPVPIRPVFVFNGVPWY